MKSVIAIFSFILFCGALQAQDRDKTFDKYLYIQDFQGFPDLIVFDKPIITDTTAADILSATLNQPTFLDELRESYLSNMGQPLTDEMLRMMSEPTQPNYDNWIQLWKQGVDTYASRSIIMSMRAQL